MEVNMTAGKIGKIVMGFADGKKEATQVPEFWKYYYDGLELKAEIEKEEKYLIAGRKGTGKTLLAFYYSEIENKKEMNECIIHSIGDIKYEAISVFNDHNALAEDQLFWKFVILAEYIRILLSDESLSADEDWAICQTYLNEIFPEIKAYIRA